MQIVGQGIVNPSGPANNRLSSTFPCVTVLPDGRLLAAYRVGSTKDSDDETVELRYSDDLGAHWSGPESPFATTLRGTRGSLKVVYPTLLSDGRLLGAALWVDRALIRDGLYSTKPRRDACRWRLCSPNRPTWAEAGRPGGSWKLPQSSARPA